MHDKSQQENRWNENTEQEEGEKKVSWKSFNHGNVCERNKNTSRVTEWGWWKKRKRIFPVSRNNCQEIIMKFISILTVAKWEWSLTEEWRHISPSFFFFFFRCDNENEVGGRGKHFIRQNMFSMNILSCLQIHRSYNFSLFSLDISRKYMKFRTEFRYGLLEESLRALSSQILILWKWKTWVREKENLLKSMLTLIRSTRIV